MSIRRASLSRRTALAFAGVAAITMVLAAGILAYIWAGQFDAYVREGLEESADAAASLISAEYERAGGWTIQAFGDMPRFGMLSGLALQVLAPDGTVIYDDSFHGSVVSRAMGEEPPSGVRVPEGPIVTAPIVVDSETVGLVRLWSLSPQGLLTENDIRFQQSSFLGLAVAAVIAVGLASLAGLWFAVTLSAPIDKVTNTAESLRSGNRDARTGMSGDDAIGVLGRTFDEMADSIEADREMERRLTADVAHELRTPLQAIQATVEAMQDGVMPADEVNLGVVRDETVRLGRLADGILELTRLERGRVEMRAELLDVAGPVRSAIDAHRALFEACGLTLSIDVTEGLHVYGDSDRLTQAVGNLVANAARYTPEGGHVTVAVRSVGDRAVIDVADTGVGIAEDDVDKVFQRFWRASNARDRTSGGLGIGLAVVKEIVERHNGTVGVARREGGGSVFSIRLPLASSVVVPS